jgi:3-oxoacyl-[acyl-carrier protein] reductase
MYKGKTIVITGTSRGVGKELALYFLNQGARVIGTSRDNCDYSIKYEHYQFDLSNTSYIKEFIIYLKEYKSIDILINNAAVLTSQYGMKMPAEKVTDMVMIDLVAPYLLSCGLAKYMTNGGRIINISSMAVPLEPMGDSMYAACKAAMNKFSNILAKEMSMFNITVNTLGISAIETDMLKQLNREKVDKVVKSLPIPRYAEMSDITNVIDFYCSEKSNYITAQTIYLGGVHN